MIAERGTRSDAPRSGNFLHRQSHVSFQLHTTTSALFFIDNMTNEEITKRYLAYRGMTRITNRRDDGFMPILPIYIMDVVYEIYCKYVAPVKPRFDMKKAKNDWREAYNLFDRDFHRAFTQDEWADIADQMDAFREYIGNELTIAVVNVMDCFSQFDLDQQQALASLAIADVLAVTAQVLWGNVYRNIVVHGRFEKDVPNVNPYIAKACRAIQNYTDLYYLSIGGEYVQVATTPKVEAARNQLIKKIVRYLNHGKDAE